MFDFATRMRPGQEAELGRRLAQALRPTQQPNLWVLFASNTQVKEMEVKVQANPYGAHVAWARINELLSAETIEVPTSTGKEGAAALVQIFEAVTECTMSNIARRADIASAEVAAPSTNPKRKKSTEPVDLGT